MAPPAKQDVGQRVCLGVVVGAHGVRGMLRIKPFTEQAEDVGAYGPVEDEAGRRRFELTIHGVHKGVVLASVKDVADRDAAMALKGTRLYVDRSVLPALEEEDTFYHADLIGLPVEDRQGRPLGRVVAVADYGAGDLLELADDKGRERVLPFTREAVPVVDLAAGRIVAEPPEEVGKPEPADNAASEDMSEDD